jgi:hypothetical protein
VGGDTLLDVARQQSHYHKCCCRFAFKFKRRLADKTVRFVSVLSSGQVCPAPKPSSCRSHREVSLLSARHRHRRRKNHQALERGTTISSLVAGTIFPSIP